MGKAYGSLLGRHLVLFILSLLLFRFKKTRHHPVRFKGQKPHCLPGPVCRVSEMPGLVGVGVPLVLRRPRPVLPTLYKFHTEDVVIREGSDSEE